MRGPSRRRLLRSLAGMGAVAGVGALSACSTSALTSSVGGARSLTVGSKTFAESWIMGELYAQGLRGIGYQVDLKTNVGSAQIIEQALHAGEIDLYPEYTGVIVVSLAGEDGLLESAEATYEFARDWEAQQGVAMLKATPFENKNAIAVRADFAQEHGLTSIEDLRGIGDFVYSTYPDNVSGAQGYEGIVESYDLPNMKLQTLSIGLNYQAIERGEIQAADVFTTDPQLLRSDLVVLDDPLNLFGFQNVVPLLRDEVLESLDTEAIDLLDTINSLLTLEAIQTLNAASAVNRLDPAQVAREFLLANDLIEG